MERLFERKLVLTMANLYEKICGSNNAGQIMDALVYSIDKLIQDRYMYMFSYPCAGTLL